MLIGSRFINKWLGDNPDGTQSPPDGNTLTMFFLLLYFLMATQDIVVDGWALTMLSRENVGYASPCNSIGQIIGVFLANQGFIALSDPVWCSKYLNIDTTSGLVSLASFVSFWGWILIIVTILLAIFKSEDTNDDGDEPDGLLATYGQVVSIFKIKPVQLLCLVLFTCRASFGPVDAGTTFKFQEYGMPKTDMASIAPLLLMFSLMMPTFTSVSIANAPIDMFLLGILLKLCSSGLVWGMFQLSIRRYTYNENYPHFYTLLVVVMGIHEVSSNLISGSMMSFFAKIADPSIGGTYMTLLNTVMNLGGKWSSVLSLYALPKLTISACYADSDLLNVLYHNCRDDESFCKDVNGICSTVLDGYTVEIFVAIVIGFLWLISFNRILNRLQHLPGSDWLSSSSGKIE